jgi:hypothetical protein
MVVHLDMCLCGGGREGAIIEPHDGAVEAAATLVYMLWGGGGWEGVGG